MKKLAAKRSGLDKVLGHPPGMAKKNRFISFGGLVALVGAATLLFFLSQFATTEFALLIGVLFFLGGVIFYDMSTRRQWERLLVDQLRRMSGDHERLVRDVARNRNDLAALKKGLADTGAAAQKLKGDDAVEDRMLKTVIDQLSKLGGLPSQPVEEEPEYMPFDLGVSEGSDLQGADVTANLTDQQVLELVHRAIRYDTIDLFAQPIVSLPQRKLRFHEVFSRIRVKPGVYLPAERYIAIAMKGDLLSALDNLLLIHCLQLIRHTADDQNTRGFFCNIAALTLSDSKFMGDLVEFISQNRTLAPRLVFEMSQRDFDTMDADVFSVLDGLSKLGCRFSMDRVTNIGIDIERLEQHNVRFIKIEGQTLLQEIEEKGGLRRLKKLKADLDRAGVDLIIEKIETEAELLDLLDVEIDYGQGYLFGRPEARMDAAT